MVQWEPLKEMGKSFRVVEQGQEWFLKAQVLRSLCM